ncbi:MAG TPA: methionyl-tRNA formyltransferase [Planctomycetes bacterium]|nr:methionyl-tRNA formyltransferase [Planctomycetota bacterium]
MKIVYFAKGRRGLICLKRIVAEGININMVVMQPGDSLTGEFTAIAKLCGAEVFVPEDPNASSAIQVLTIQEADVFVLAGYGLILKEQCIAIPKTHCINLHGGRLPQYRGSSPMNWALINNEPIIGISIIEVDQGIDTGAVLSQEQMEVDPDTTITDLHDWANQQFPEMLVKVLQEMVDGDLCPRIQDDENACYYPRRFPDDGMVLWDQLSALQVHNRIRGLTKPYPCAYTYYGKRRVRLAASKIPGSPLRGEAGRVYRKAKGSLLVGASDQAIWITEAEFVDDESPLYDVVERYDCLATVREAAINFYHNFA